MITLPASNNGLAAQVGTVRELVSRNLSHLQLQNGAMTIVDLEQLEAELDTAP